MMNPTPVQVSQHVYALPLNVMFAGNPTTIHPAVILDDVHGATLVDTGTPGMHDQLHAMLAALGLSWNDIKRVIITHHDLDHLGSLPAVLAATHAEVLTSSAEVPYVQGEQRGQKQPSPEMIANMPPEMAAHFRTPPSAPVTRTLRDQEVLEVAGGLRVVLTPGHTVGHLSLFVERDGVLISGDALVSHAGQLAGPMERATPDMAEAKRSVQKLARLSASKVLTYHGGIVHEDVAAQLIRVAAQATS